MWRGGLHFWACAACLLAVGDRHELSSWCVWMPQFWVATVVVTGPLARDVSEDASARPASVYVALGIRRPQSLHLTPKNVVRWGRREPAHNGGPSVDWQDTLLPVRHGTDHQLIERVSAGHRIHRSASSVTEVSSNSTHCKPILLILLRLSSSASHSRHITASGGKKQPRQTQKNISFRGNSLSFKSRSGSFLERRHALVQSSPLHTVFSILHVTPPPPLHTESSRSLSRSNNRSSATFV